MFVAKYNTTGIIQWVKQISGTESQSCYGMGIDAIGNVYVFGRFNDFTTFNPTTSINSTSNDLFIAKYTTAGIFSWANPIGGASEDEPKSSTVDANGNVYITGLFFGTVDFDPGNTPHELSGTFVNTPFPVLAKYNNQGEYQWAKKFEATNISSNLDHISVATNGGSVYLTGNFEGVVDFNLDADINKLLISLVLVLMDFIKKFILQNMMHQEITNGQKI